MKTKSGACLALFLFINTTAGATTCPNLKVDATCVNSKWQIYVKIPSPYWEETSAGIPSEKSCNNGEKATRINWNYALHVARIGQAICNYTLRDNSLVNIKNIQISSYRYIHTGEHWEAGKYPGYWKCTFDQEYCFFDNN